MSGGLTAAGLAAVLIIILLIQGGTGRIGIVLALMAGSQLGIAATLFGAAWDFIGMIQQFANSFGGAVG